MSYSLNTVPKINDLLYASDSDSRKVVANSLNLKYNLWKHKTGDNFHILKYNKDWLSADSVETLGLLRSLIYKDDGTVVSFAPPKSLHTDKISFDNDTQYVAETFVEGTMINMFYDKTANTWEIATRSSVGGEMSFYMEGGFKKENTFRSMFNEVCEYIEFDYDNYVGDNNNKNYVYSFVMQHPKNRIVKVISEMKLYLVDVFEIVDKTVNIVDFRNLDLNISDKLKYPRQEIITDANSLEQCKESCASMNTPYHIQGVIIKSNNGQRYKFRNPNYEHVRQLRGNQPKLQYQYIALRQSGQVKEYLQYYKEHNKPFEEFRQLIHDYTNQLFENYRRCYVKKERELKTFPDKYKTHMYTLHHELYLKQLRSENKYVNKEVVVNYINGLHPAKQMFVMNYDMRKAHIDTTRNDEPVEEISSIEQ
jgi:hypothetical protein